MSQYKEIQITFHHVTEYGNDTSYFENKWFEARAGETVLSCDVTMSECISRLVADNVRNDYAPETEMP